MRFAKWQGIGNDYLVVHEREASGLTPELVTLVCDRHFGVGGDGILVLGDSDVADARMVIHNPDGSRAEMCGNGIRMAARWLAAEAVLDGPEMSIETEGGIMRPRLLDDGRVRVDMGRLTTEGRDVVSVGEGAGAAGEGGAAGGGGPAGSGSYEGRVVSVGNPHFVITLDPDELPLERVGPPLEHHARFPNRTNVEFIAVESPSRVRMRVWERGVGETLACGTGACAVGATAVLDHGCTSPVTVVLPGGELEIEVDPDTLHVHMTGPAAETFRGELDLVALARGAHGTALDAAAAV